MATRIAPRRYARNNVARAASTRHGRTLSLARRRGINIMAAGAGRVAAARHRKRGITHNSNLRQRHMAQKHSKMATASAIA